MDYKELNNYLTNYNKLSTNLGTSDTHDIKINEMVCPCCGKKLRLSDSTKKEFEGDDLIPVNESLLNENKLADYLLDIIESEARAIYEDELESNEPETDAMGNIVGDYNERFLYLSKDLKKIIKMKANAISNMVRHQGIEVTPYYIENELYDYLKYYGYAGKR